MQHIAFPTMWAMMEEKGLLPLADLDLNQTGGYLMRVRSGDGETLVATLAAPINGVPPYHLHEATIGFNNHTPLVASQTQPARAPAIIDISGRTLDQTGSELFVCWKTYCIGGSTGKSGLENTPQCASRGGCGSGKSNTIVLGPDSHAGRPVELCAIGAQWTNLRRTTFQYS